jgi:hypothetical protein
VASRLAPRSSSRRTVASCPFWTAMWSIVKPCVSLPRNRCRY